MTDIFPIKDFFPKTLNDVGFDLRRKGITTSKSEIPNSFHAVWNVDAREGFTIIVFTTDYYSIFYR